MGSSQIVTTSQDTSTVNTTEYQIIGGNMAFTPTEADVKIPWREPGVISNLSVLVTANSIPGQSSLRLRKNGANSNLVALITALTSQYYTDSVHTESIAAGDQINFSFTPGATSGTVTIVNISFMFIATNGSITHCKYVVTSSITNNVSENDYHTFGGILQNTNDTTTEAADILFTPKVPLNIKHFVLYSPTSVARAVALRVYKNSVDDAVNRPLIASGSSGITEDSSSSVSLNGSTDTACLLLGFGGGSVTRTVNWFAVSLENTGNYFYFFAGRSEGIGFGVGLTRYQPINGTLTTSFTSEGDTKTKALFPMNISKLTLAIITNTINSGTTVVTLRKNGVDTALSVSVTNGGTDEGIFSDSSNVVSIAAGDDIDYKIVTGGSTGTTTLGYIGSLVESLPNVIDGVSDYKDILKQRPQQLITNSI